MARFYSGVGFTLMELVIVIGVSSFLLVVSFPAVDLYLSQQRLKQSASHVTSFVQSARSIASSTECPTRLSLRNNNNALLLTLDVMKQDKWRGCLRWFKARGGTANLARMSTLSLASTRLNNGEQVINFDAVSGLPQGSALQTIHLSDRGQTMVIQLNGIGNGRLQEN